MQQIYSNVSKVLVDVRNGANLLYLPLDKLLQQAGVRARGGGAGRRAARGAEQRHGGRALARRAARARPRSRRPLR